MSFTIDICEERKRVTIVGCGTADASSFRACLIQVASADTFRPGFRILVDSRRLDYTPTVEETREFVKFHLGNEKLKASKVAIVVAKDIDIGMANMFSILCDLGDAAARSFRSITEAEAWLEERK